MKSAHRWTDNELAYIVDVIRNGSEIPTDGAAYRRAYRTSHLSKRERGRRERRLLLRVLLRSASATFEELVEMGKMLDEYAQRTLRRGC